MRSISRRVGWAVKYLARLQRYCGKTFPGVQLSIDWDLCVGGGCEELAK